MSLVERDEADATLDALDLGGDGGRWAGTALMIKWHDARGSVAFARGDHATAYAEHRAAGELAQASMIVNPAISPWRSSAALAAAHAGDADQARALVDEEVGLARRFAAAGTTARPAST